MAANRRDNDQLLLRLPDGLRDRIKETADRNGRSLTSEIVFTLTETYPAPIEPESINEALLEAAQEVAEKWASVLATLGQSPDDNQPLQRLMERLEKAGKMKEGEADP